MQAEVENAKKVKADFEKDWLGLPHVVSIGIGFVDAMKIGIIVGVSKDVDEIRHKIPASIDGVRIVVELTDIPSAF